MRAVASSGAVAAGRILLVDDNQPGLAARKSVLEELGHRITTATGGHEALEHFAKDRYDLVVTDFKMPRMNGIEFIERLRKLRPALPIILVSGFAEPLGLDESNTGADVVIQKSANEVAHLVRAVNRLLRRTAVPKSRRASNSRSSSPSTKRCSAGFFRLLTYGFSNSSLSAFPRAIICVYAGNHLAWTRNISTAPAHRRGAGFGSLDRGEPGFPQGHRFSRLDAILISHGHFDHIHDVIALAGQFSPRVVAIYETCHCWNRRELAIRAA